MGEEREPWTSKQEEPSQQKEAARTRNACPCVSTYLHTPCMVCVGPPDDLSHTAFSLCIIQRAVAHPSRAAWTCSRRRSGGRRQREPRVAWGGNAARTPRQLMQIPPSPVSLYLPIYCSIVAIGLVALRRPKLDRGPAQARSNLARRTGRAGAGSCERRPPGPLARPRVISNTKWHVWVRIYISMVCPV